MEFAIKDKEGKKILMNDLDREAANFWKVEYSEDSYCTPDNQYILNWYDSIGWCIASQKRVSALEFNTWDNVIQRMLDIYLPGTWGENISVDLYLDQTKKVFEKLKPYFDLIKHWRDKEYYPVSLQN